MQELIARFGGTPALIIKILFLGAVNSLAIWAIPHPAERPVLGHAGILLVSTIALDFLFLTKRYIPAKYVIIGTILLFSFQIVPIVYNISIAFTNYSTGNVGTKEDAVLTIERDSAAASEDSAAYDMVPVYDQTGALVLLLSPQTPIEDTTGTETLPTDETSAVPRSLRPPSSARRTRRPRRRSSARRTPRPRRRSSAPRTRRLRLRSSAPRTRRLRPPSSAPRTPRRQPQPSRTPPQTAVPPVPVRSPTSAPPKAWRSCHRPPCSATSSAW